MKPGLQRLKARLAKAGVDIDRRPICERCRCERCGLLHRTTSGEKRHLYGLLLARGFKVLAEIGPEAHSEILTGLEEAGLKLVRVDSSQAEELAGGEQELDLKAMLHLNERLT